VVPRQADVVEMLNAFYAFVGVWTIPNQVSEAPYLIKVFCVFENRLQCRAVRVKVRDN
jgi:hypothetical protein